MSGGHVDKLQVFEASAVYHAKYMRDRVAVRKRLCEDAAYALARKILSSELVQFEEREDEHELYVTVKAHICLPAEPVRALVGSPPKMWMNELRGDPWRALFPEKLKIGFE